MSRRIAFRVSESAETRRRRRAMDVLRRELSPNELAEAAEFLAEDTKALLDPNASSDDRLNAGTTLEDMVDFLSSLNALLVAEAEFADSLLLDVEKEIWRRISEARYARWRQAP